MSARVLPDGARSFSLSGEPSRGLAASRRPSGAVRFTGSPDRRRDTPAGQHSAFKPTYRKSTTNQQTTKVSTLSQDLTRQNFILFRASGEKEILMRRP